MSALKKLKEIQAERQTIMCLGLDLDTRRMPHDYTKNIKMMYDFAAAIIDATADLVCAYKPNLAFYESLGAEGLSLLQKIVTRIPKEIPVILDAKRGDIGNTAAHYADALFDRLSADWVTLNPYMGYDSLRPFLERKDKGVFILALTSNPGSRDFQQLVVDGKPLYRIVAEKVLYWNKDDNCGLVFGATAPEQLREMRHICGDMPLLIPGVGAQGGSLEKAASYGTDNFKKTALINVCRSVLYASRNSDFAQRARQELSKLNAVVNSLRASKEETENQSDHEPETTAPTEGQQTEE